MIDLYTGSDAPSGGGLVGGLTASIPADPFAALEADVQRDRKSLDPFAGMEEDLKSDRAKLIAPKVDQAMGWAERKQNDPNSIMNRELFGISNKDILENAIPGVDIVRSIRGTDPEQVYRKAKAAYDDYLEGGKEPTDAQIGQIAEYQLAQQRKAQRGIGQHIALGVANLPKILGETAVIGPAISAPLRAAGLLGRSAPAAKDLLTMGGARQGAAFAAERVAEKGLTGMALPAMVIPTAQQRATQGGGEWTDAKNLLPALGVAGIKNVVLGTIGNQVGNVRTVAGRAVGGGALGTVENMVGDAVLTGIDRLLPGAYKTKTEFGVIGDMLAGRKGEVWKHLAADLVSNGLISSLHPRSPNPIKGFKDSIEGKSEPDAQQAAQDYIDGLKQSETPTGGPDAIKPAPTAPAVDGDLFTPKVEIAQPAALRSEREGVYSLPEGQIELGTAFPAKSKYDAGIGGDAMGMFPDQVQPGQKIARIHGIEVKEGERGKGVGQRLYLEGMKQHGADWYYNSQAEPGAVRALQALERKGAIELHWRGEPGGPHIVRPKPPERRGETRPPESLWAEMKAEHPDWTPEQLGQEAARQLESARQDPLTGLWGNWQLHADLKSGKYGEHVTLFDVPGLGAVNKFGDQAGDALLAAYGKAMKDAGITRGYRKGGDEMAAIFDSPEAQKAAGDKLEKLLEGAEVHWEGADGSKEKIVGGLGVARSEGRGILEAQAGLPRAKEVAVEKGFRSAQPKELPPRLRREITEGPPRPEAQERPDVQGPLRPEAEPARPAEGVAPPKPPEPQPPSTDLNRPQSPDEIGLRNAATDQLREARGLPPRMEVDPVGHTFPDLRDQVMSRLRADPTAGANLVASLKEKPRPVSDLEDAMVLHRLVEVDNRYEAAIRAVDEAKKSGNVEATALAENNAAELRTQLRDTSDVAVAMGTASGRSLNARKMVLARDFSLGRMEYAKEQAKGAPLTAAERAQVKEASEKIRAMQERIDKLEAERRTERIKKIDQEPNKPRTEKARKEVDAAWDHLKKVTTGKLFSTPLDPALIGATVRLSKAYVKLGVAKFADFVAAVRAKAGKDLTPEAEDVLKQGWTRAQDELARERATAMVGRAKATDPAGMGRLAQRLYKQYAQSGLEGMDQRIDAVHADLQTIDPTITRDQTMDAISGYGVYTQLTKGQLEAEIRDQKGQMQQLGKLRDMAEHQAPKKTGIERRVPSARERELIKQVNEKKKELGYDVTDPETQLKTALDSAKTRMRNQIEDLDRQIASGKKDERTESKLKPDAELEALTAQRDALRARFDEIFSRPDMTDAQRLAAATKAVERSIAELTDRINKRDFSAKTGKRATSEELEALRARRDALKDEFESLKAQDPASQKAAAEKSDRMLQAYYADKAAELRERIARGDFAPAKKPEPRLSPEAARAKAEFQKASDDWRLELLKDERAKEDGLRKNLRRVGDTLDLLRAIKLGGDLPPALRQGGFFTASHPIKSAKAFWATRKAVRGELQGREILAEIAERPNAQNGAYKRAMGLDLTNPHGADEFMQSNWIKRVPFFRSMERWHSVYLTRARADFFDTMAAGLSKDGKLTPAQEKLIGNAVNVFTGKGNLGQMERSVNVLNKVFLAPKWVVSRFQTALPVPGNPLLHGVLKKDIGKQPAVRAEIAKQYLRAAAGFGTVIGLAGLAAKAGMGVSVEDDPRSSDFGDIRVRNTRVNPVASLNTAVRFASQFISGQRKIPDQPGIQPVTGMETIGKEFRYKLAPVPGAVWTGTELARKDLGVSRKGPPRPFAQDWAELAADTFPPLTVMDFIKASEDLGIPGGPLVGFFASLGASPKVYDDKK